MKWFKFYGQDWLTDIKIIKMQIEDRLCFLTLLCLASSFDDGIIKNCDEQTIINLTHLYLNPYDDDNEYTRAIGFLKRLNDNKIITIDNAGNVTINNFSKRQSQNLSGYERVKRYRKKQKNEEIIKNKLKKNDNNDNNDNINDNDDNIYDNADDNPRVDKNRVDNIYNTCPSENEPTGSFRLDDKDFELFWNTYPRKVGRKKVQENFKKIKGVKISTIVDAVEKYKKTKQWQDPQFIPLPATWLNQERWEDEIEIQTDGQSIKQEIFDLIKKCGDKENAMHIFVDKYGEEETLKYHNMFT